MRFRSLIVCRMPQQVGNCRLKRGYIPFDHPPHDSEINSEVIVNQHVLKALMRASPLPGVFLALLGQTLRRFVMNLQIE